MLIEISVSVTHHTEALTVHYYFEGKEKSGKYEKFEFVNEILPFCGSACGFYTHLLENYYREKAIKCLAVWFELNPMGFS